MNRPCANRDICPGTDFPVTNFSSEAPDIFTFRQLHYPIFPPNDPLGPGGNGDPPIYLAVGCQRICESTVSQEDADLCAQRAAQECYLGGGGNQFFFNNAQICFLPCGAGSNFFWTVAAGEFVAGTQAGADEQAMAYACQQAAAHAFCMNQIDGTAEVGVLYAATIFVVGAARTPVTFAVVAGSLPPGLSLTPEQGLSTVLNGKPTTAGTYTFTIQATDAFGIFVQQQYTITVTSTCPAFWSSFNGLWIPTTGGPNSVATVVGNVATLVADAPLPGPSTGVAQLTAQAIHATTDQLTCSITIQSVTVFNPPPPANTQFSILIQDAFLPNVYLNLSFASNTMPAPGTVYNFTMPAGATAQISFICFTINAINGADSIIGATLILG